MRKNTETEIVRLYLNGSTLDYMAKKFKMTTQEVGNILFDNPATAEVLREENAKYKNGEFVRSFTDSNPGRSKLSDKKKKKLRQVRISDEEMESMGNPSTTEIRKRAMKYDVIFEVIDLLEEKSLINIPNEWLEVDLNDPFWGNSLNSQSKRLKYLLNNHRLIKEAKRTEA